MAIVACPDPEKEESNGQRPRTNVGKSRGPVSAYTDPGSCAFIFSIQDEQSSTVTMNLKTVLLVVTSLSTSAVAAPKKSENQTCHPAKSRGNDNDTQAITKGFLTFGENNFQGRSSPLVLHRNIQPVNGGLEVVTWDQAEIHNRGVQMQFLECNVPESKYSPPSKAPFKTMAEDTPVFAGQLATEDSRSCVTMKNETVSMEDCAKEDGDQLAAQWLHLVGNRLVFAGKAGSPLEAEVKMDGEKVKRFADQGLKDSYNVLFLENTPMDGQEAQKPLGVGDSVQEKSESSAGQSRSFSVLFTAAVLSVAAWMVGPIC